MSNQWVEDETHQTYTVGAVSVGVVFEIWVAVDRDVGVSLRSQELRSDVEYLFKIAFSIG